MGTSESETHFRPQLVFGHPRALVFLAATELWDRVSFQSMQALLVLYMVEQLLLPGHIENVAGISSFRAAIETATGPLSTQALASQIFGLYVGLANLSPIFGGWLGDRFWGRRLAVTMGAVLMTAGHFFMAFDESFLLAMLLLILGAGCLRGNLTPQVGELYTKEDRRRNTAFQIYYSMVNLGGFIGPLVSGALGQAYGWHVGFGFAGIGMLLGLVIYLAGRRDLPPEAVRDPRSVPPSLRPGERLTVVFLIMVMLVVALFYVAQSQIWNTYNLWVRDHIDLRFGAWTIPVPWLQSFDGLMPVVSMPLLLVFWRWQAGRASETNEFVKMAVGCFIFSAATLWLSSAEFVAAGNGRAPFLWAVFFHFASNLGWLFFVPTSIALIARIAPKQVNATMIGLFYFGVFLGSIISGRLGGLYEQLPSGLFWALHAAIVGFGGILILIIGSVMRRTFNTSDQETVLAAQS